MDKTDKQLIDEEAKRLTEELAALSKKDRTPLEEDLYRALGYKSQVMMKIVDSYDNLVKSLRK